MARPAKDINEAQLKALMRLNPTLADTAAFFECSERTIERFIRDEFDLSFVEFRDQNMVHTRLELIRSALKKSERSDTMHIFCLKNLCGWKNEPGQAPAQSLASRPQMTDEQFDEYVTMKAAERRRK